MTSEVVLLAGAAMGLVAAIGAAVGVIRILDRRLAREIERLTLMRSAREDSPGD